MKLRAWLDEHFELSRRRGRQRPGDGGVAKTFVLFLGFGLLCFCVFARPES